MTLGRAGRGRVLTAAAAIKPGRLPPEKPAGVAAEAWGGARLNALQANGVGPF